MQNDRKYWDFFIIKYLHKLSLRYPYINDIISINGLGVDASKVKIYCDNKIIEPNLSNSLLNLENMMKDKPKGFLYFGMLNKQIWYSKIDAEPINLKECFELFRDVLRSDKLDDLLGID